MNTTEMYLKAQKDGLCYCLINKGEDYNGEIFYQKDRSLFDNDGDRIYTNVWNYFESLMEEEWKVRTMTREEAELRFNIKIID